MAISLLFGALTSVTLIMITLPLRCVSAIKAFLEKAKDEEETAQPGLELNESDVSEDAKPVQAAAVLDPG